MGCSHHYGFFSFCYSGSIFNYFSSRRKRSSWHPHALFEFCKFNLCCLPFPPAITTTYMLKFGHSHHMIYVYTSVSAENELLLFFPIPPQYGHGNLSLFKFPFAFPDTAAIFSAEVSFSFLSMALVHFYALILWKLCLLMCCLTFFLCSYCKI